MAEKKRCLMLGAGGMAGSWLRRFFPRFGDRLEVAALVDVDQAVLDEAGDFLGLPAARRFRSMAPAFETVDADFCAIVIPPAFHEEAVLHAVRRGLPVLSEKPISDTWDGCRRIYAAATRAGLKVQVIQNYRYGAAMLTMRHVLRSGELGRLNYLIGRYAQDYRVYGSWGAPFRHEIPHSLLVEGAVHHLDMLRNLAGADCARLTGWEWNPAWSTSKGAFCNLFAMEMTNGVRAGYEGSATAAGTQNPWSNEYYRAECERGALEVVPDWSRAAGRRRPPAAVRIHRFTPGQGLDTQDVPLIDPPHTGHSWLIAEFLDWLDGGPTPATVLEENVQSVAMVFAAIEASRTTRVVDVQAMVRELRQG